MTSGIALTGRKRTTVVIVIAFTLLMAAAFAGAFRLLSDGREVASRSVAGRAPSSSARGESRSIDLGTIQCGGRAKARFRLTNDSDSEIEIVEARTSCSCLRVELTARRIAPNEAAEGMVTLDLADEPGFTGGLCPELELLDATRRARFNCTVTAKVVSVPRAGEVAMCAPSIRNTSEQTASPGNLP